MGGFEITAISAGRSDPHSLILAARHFLTIFMFPVNGFEGEIRIRDIYPA
jgi:hypothetical protein